MASSTTTSREQTPARAPHETRRLTFYTGALSGFSVASGLVLAWLAVQFRDQRAIIAAFEAPVSSATAIASHPLFLALSPVCVIGAVVLTNVLAVPPRTRLRLAVGVALVAVAAVVFCHWANTAPFTALADGVEAR